LSISHTEQSRQERTIRVKNALCYEIEKLMIDIKGTGLDWPSLYSYLNRRTSKLEWMIIESIYKGAPFENLDNTLLILPDQYIEMLKHITVVFQDVFHNATNIMKTRIVSV